MRVLLCLLSDQHVPNLLSVHHYRPDKLVLLETQEMKKKGASAHFKEALRLGGLDMDKLTEVVPLPEGAENNFPKMRRALKQAYSCYPSAEWIANVTGGTKPMSIAAYEFFKAKGGRVVYVDVARPSTFLDLETEEKEECAHKISIGEFLAGYGFSVLTKHPTIQEHEGKAREWAECARLVAQKAPSQTLLPLFDKERSEAREKGWDVQPGQIPPLPEKIEDALSATFGLKKTNGALCGPVDEYGAKFLTGGWLEVFFWSLLSKHQKELGIWDVRLGLDIGSKDKKVNNEFDVAFIHNYSLCMIECKSGAQEHDQKADALYKLETKIRQFRALRVSSYLATTGKNVLDSEGKLKKSLANRAAIYNCKIFTAEDIQNLARSWDKPDNVRQIFFEKGS